MRSLVIGAVAFIMIGCVGCGTLSFGVPSPAQTIEEIRDMSHEDRAVLAMATYNTEWEAYQRIKGAYETAFPEEMPYEAQEDLAKRRDILKKIYPIIQRYDNFTTAGGVLRPKDVQEILTFLRLYYLNKQGG